MGRTPQVSKDVQHAAARPHRLPAVRSSFSVHDVSADRKVVWIVDHDVGRSVTNDAEAVCANLHERFPSYQIIYRDTMGRWDELVHESGVFRGYAPAGSLLPAVL